MGAYHRASAVFTGIMTVTFKMSVSSPGFKLGASWCGVSPHVVMESEGSLVQRPDCKEEFLLLHFSWTSLNFVDASSSSKDKETSREMGYAFKHSKILSRMLMSYFGPPLI